METVLIGAAVMVDAPMAPSYDKKNGHIVSVYQCDGSREPWYTLLMYDGKLMESQSDRFVVHSLMTTEDEGGNGEPRESDNG